MDLPNRLEIDTEYAADETGKQSIRELFESELFSDCIIQCGNRVWRLHRSILASRSSYFAAMFNFTFPESKANTIIPLNDNPLAMQILLRHFYHPFITSDELEDYAKDYIPDYKHIGSLPTTIELVQVADKYGAIGLISICEINLEEQLEREACFHSHAPRKSLYLSRMFLSTIFQNGAFSGMKGVKRGAAKYTADAYKYYGSYRSELNKLLQKSSEFRMMVLDSLSGSGCSRSIWGAGSDTAK